MDFAKMFQRGGIIAGTAAACSILLPIHGASLSTSSLTVWALIVTGAAALILQTGKYHVAERVEVIGITLKTSCAPSAPCPSTSSAPRYSTRRAWCPRAMT
ncbi:hypothetical protein ACFVAQ_21540 [Streptomyces sp. NPDC057651]|uniref:hypothetical protein n=1 Tax=Streptomyces sp. NPDC057651 TaxID=3346194 RepID=UPI0036974A41